MYNEDMEKIMKKHSKKKLTRANAIRIYCKEMCCAGDLKSWKECDFYACSLWRFRLGREMLGNQTSFKKHKVNRGVLEQKQQFEEEVEEKNDTRD